MTLGHNHLRGYAEAIAAASLWASSGVFAVNLFRMGLPPESLALLRPLVGGLILLTAVCLRRPAVLRIDLQGLAIIMLGGGFAVGVFQVAYQFSTDAVGVPSTVAMLYVAPAIVTTASGPLLGEWPDRTRLILLGVTLFGVWLSVFGATEVSSLFDSSGFTWGILAGVSYGAYTLFGRFAAPRYGSLPTVVYSTLGSCLFLALVVPATTGPIVLPSSGPAWALLFTFSLLTIAVAHFLFFDSLVYIDAGRASIATAIEPVIAAVLATVLLSQSLSPVGWLGITLVVSGVVGVGLTSRVQSAATGDLAGEKPEY